MTAKRDAFKAQLDARDSENSGTQKEKQGRRNTDDPKPSQGRQLTFAECSSSTASRRSDAVPEAGASTSASVADPTPSDVQVFSDDEVDFEEIGDWITYPASTGQSTAAAALSEFPASSSQPAQSTAAAAPVINVSAIPSSSVASSTPSSSQLAPSTAATSTVSSSPPVPSPTPAPPEINESDIPGETVYEDIPRRLTPGRPVRPGAAPSGFMSGSTSRVFGPELREPTKLPTVDQSTSTPGPPVKDAYFELYKGSLTEARNSSKSTLDGAKNTPDDPNTVDGESSTPDDPQNTVVSSKNTVDSPQTSKPRRGRPPGSKNKKPAQKPAATPTKQGGGPLRESSQTPAAGTRKRKRGAETEKPQKAPRLPDAIMPATPPAFAPNVEAPSPPVAGEDAVTQAQPPTPDEASTSPVATEEGNATPAQPPASAPAPAVAAPPPAGPRKNRRANPRSRTTRFLRGAGKLCAIHHGCEEAVIYRRRGRIRQINSRRLTRHGFPRSHVELGDAEHNRSVEHGQGWVRGGQRQQWHSSTNRQVSGICGDGVGRFLLLVEFVGVLSCGKQQW
ncbi:unnamed protein product [Periconia digitata]|uniref:Uncharacterized protein n=1 Tax=Periconia digitata TaxID=1303443 RepID=A0A9W4UC56_9PLEO|nr:unnamed protein product [Periconia digitata]